MAKLDNKLMMELLYRPCKTKKELNNWIKTFLKIHLFDSTIDPHSNSNPLEVCWNIYRTAVWYDDVPNNEKYLKSIIYAARGTAKTLMVTVLEYLIMIHAGRNVIHIGLQESHSKTAYNTYFRPFLNLDYVKNTIKPKTNSTIERTTLIDRLGNDVTIHCIPCTMNKTSSLRGNLIVFDEIDKAKGEQIIAYKNSYGQLTSTNDGKLPISLAISTRDTAFGLIQNEIDKAKKTGTKVLHWSLLDITQYCSDEKSGIEPVPIYIKKDSLDWIKESEYITLNDSEKTLYVKNWVLDGCLNCFLCSICCGYLKNQESKCAWIKTHENAEQAIKQMADEDMIIAQLLCRKPPTSGLVYPNFSTKNIVTAEEIYEIFTKEKCTQNLNIEEMIDIFNQYDISRYIAADAGFHNPAALLIFVDKNENIYVLKNYTPNNIDSPEFANNIYNMWGKYKPWKGFSDPESPDLSSALNKKFGKGFCHTKIDKSIQNGLATVKGFLKVPNTRITKLFIYENCIGLIEEMSKKYKYKLNSDGTYSDKPCKEWDHSSDCLRYFIHTHLGQKKSNLNFDIKQNIENEPYIQKQLKPENVVKIAHGNSAQIIDNRDEIFDKKDKKKDKRNSKYDFTKF